MLTESPDGLFCEAGGFQGADCLLASDAFKRIEKFIKAHSVFHIAKERIDRNASAAKTEFAPHALGIAPNEVFRDVKM